MSMKLQRLALEMRDATNRGEKCSKKTVSRLRYVALVLQKVIDEQQETTECH